MSDYHVKVRYGDWSVYVIGKKSDVDTRKNVLKDRMKAMFLDMGINPLAVQFEEQEYEVQTTIDNRGE